MDCPHDSFSSLVSVNRRPDHVLVLLRIACDTCGAEILFDGPIAREGVFHPLAVQRGGREVLLVGQMARVEEVIPGPWVTARMAPAPPPDPLDVQDNPVCGDPTP